MADALTEQLIQRNLQPTYDPQSAWQKASSIGSNPITLSMMPGLPGKGIINRILELLASSSPEPSTKQVEDLPRSPTLGEHNPEFTPVGGEGAYNSVRPELKKFISPVEKAYERILLRGGR